METFHHGYLHTPNHYPDRFFIISRNESRQFRELSKKGPIPLEQLQKIGWEFKDPRIVKPFTPPGGEIGIPPSQNWLSRYIDWRFKKVFIFGAGASSFWTFGESGKKLREHPWCPPLATELFDSRFDEIINKYPGAKDLIPYFEARGKDIEAAMEDRWQRIRTTFATTELASYINVQFFLQELSSRFTRETQGHFFRSSLYKLFADKIAKFTSENGKEGIGLVSFNYDTLLDDELGNYNELELNSLDGYVNYNEKQIVLLKPHGSYNWGWRFPGENTNVSLAQTLYENKSSLAEIYFDSLGDYGKMVLRESWGREKGNHKHDLGRYTINKNLLEVIPEDELGAWYPALLVPLRDKDEFLMPYHHEDTLDMISKEVEELFLIGWKGGEDLFNRRIQKSAQNLKRIIIVNPDLNGVKQCISPYFDLENLNVEHVKYFEEFVLEAMDKYMET